MDAIISGRAVAVPVGRQSHPDGAFPQTAFGLVPHEENYVLVAHCGTASNGGLERIVPKHGLEAGNAL